MATLNKDLANVGVGFSPLSGKLYIFEVNKRDKSAKRKREIEPVEILGPVADYMIHNMPNGACQDIYINSKLYTITVEPVKEDV